LLCAGCGSAPRHRSGAPSGSVAVARHSRTAPLRSRSRARHRPPAASGIAGAKDPACSETSRRSDTPSPVSRALSPPRSFSCRHPAQRTRYRLLWFVSDTCLRIGAKAGQPSSRSNNPSRHVGANHIQLPQDKHLA
jgi:hypothetical protein